MSGRSSFRAGLVASFMAAACCGAVARAAEPLAHFQCYRAQAAAAVGSETMTLTDQFGQIEARIESLERTCNPTDTNDENPEAPTRPEHLTEYTLRRLSAEIPPQPQLLSVTNQFGTVVLELRHHLEINPRSLLVPSAVSTTSPAPPEPAPDAISHFTCYHVHPDPRRMIEQVELEDEIGAQTFYTRSAEELCVPAKKDDEDVVATDTPLLCYLLRRVGERPAPRTVHATDEFGSSAVRLWTGWKQLVCVPSTLVVLP